MDGVAAAVFAAGGRVGGVLEFGIADCKIVEIGIVADPMTASTLNVVTLDAD